MEDADKRYVAPGCTLCREGAKLVLFVTGRCGRSCWYCPLSAERKGTDRVWANDREVVRDDDLLAEAGIMSALGTGVTGGDPLLAIDRVVRFCRLLKTTFGPEHQIHLYTGRAPGDDELEALAGLVDEIRLHPPHQDWERILETPYPDAILRARARGFAIGIEVPSLPGIEGLRPLLPLVDFFNINELEWGEASADGMRARGLELADTLGNAVAGAREWAAPLLGDEKVRYCSSAFKDAVQLRERMIRIAVNTARPFDEVTGDGTVVYGMVRFPEGAGPVIAALGLDDSEYVVVDGAIELGWERLAAGRSAVAGEKAIVERYPNRGMVVEVTPL
ncbi:MAG: 4Fe-4S cluster-binding domain-containing protein [Methanospirillum sp.]